MGQKVNPTLFRIGKIFSWKSRWFGDAKHYSDQVVEDYQVRRYLAKKLANAGLDEVEIERSVSAMKVTLHVSRPGVVIGKGGANLQEIKDGIEKLVAQLSSEKKPIRVNLRVEEIKRPDLSAKLVADRIASQIAARYPYRRAINQALEKVMAAGAKGVKIQLSGRINGAEIGRTEKYALGSVPTQTLKADIDYFEAPAVTRSGYVGMKIWVYRGNISELQS